MLKEKVQQKAEKPEKRKKPKCKMALKSEKGANWPKIKKCQKAGVGGKLQHSPPAKT